MTRGLKGIAKFCKQSLSLVIAFSMMLSVCAISGVSLDAFAASTSFEYDAKTDASFNTVKDAGGFIASCSYYDYLDDQELSSGTWGNVKVAGNSATWYPFDTLNSQLNTYYRENSIKKPLYYGNFNTGTMLENDRWRRDEYWQKTNGLYNYDAAPNNSKAVYYDSINWNVSDIGTLAGYGDPPAWSYSYQGIVSKNLKNGKLQMMKTDNWSTVDAPFFSDEFLSKQYYGTSTSLGRKVNSVLPFTYNPYTKKYSYQSSTEVTHTNPINGIYLENSNRGSSTNNLYNVGANSLTMKYGGANTSTGIRDGKLWFNSGDSGYGFFPFNNNTGYHTSGDVRNDLNYGFGMVLSLDFTVPDNGCIEGTNNPVEFTFAGDDDIWIFIDDKLVVDLGGNHKDAKCTINFKDKRVNYNTGINAKAVTSASDEYSIADVMNGSTSNTVHSLKMFYMERGLIESNIKVEFSFSPIDNYLTTEKVVDTTNVNSGLKSAVESKDTFVFSNVSNGIYNSVNNALIEKPFIHTDATGVESSRTTWNNIYYMKSKEKASYENITDTGDYLTISESESSNLSYSSTYTVTDVQNNNVLIKSGTGTSANFLFQNSVNKNQMTKYNVKFVNTPNVSDLSVTKVEKNSSGTVNSSGEDFTFTILVDINGGENYIAYPLQYTLNGVTYTANNGIFNLKGGQTATFKNIPVGASYKVVETVNANYTTTPSNRTYTGKVESTGSNLTFTNTEIKKGPASVQFEFVKYLDGETPDTNEFEFTLTLLKKDGSTLVKDKLLQTVRNNGKYVQFAPMTYDGSEHETLPPPETEPTTEPLPPPLEGDNVIYFNSKAWNVGNGWISVYAWDDNDNVTFVKMEKLSNTIYGVDLDKAYPNVIFVQMPSESTSVGWDNIVRQTADLEVPEGKDYFTVNSDENGANGTWSTYTSTSSYNLIRSANSEPDEDIHYVDYAAIKASSVETYYYLIEEKQLDNPAYEYDTKSIYAVVTVDKTTNPNTATHKYYMSADNALNNRYPTNGTAKLAFNNYHKGSIEITKKSGEDLITDTVKFSLYKASSDGGELVELIDEKTVDNNGKVKFSGLDISSKGNSSSMQWYCFVETQAKDGYMINNTKYYFTIPASQKLADQSSTDYDYHINGVKYKYLRSDDNKLIYDIKVDVDNYAVVTPKTSGTGINFYLFLGLGIIGTGAMLAVSYSIYDKAQRKKRKARYTATHY